MQPAHVLSGEQLEYEEKAARHASRAKDRPGYQAYMILYAGFIALPILAGADKFFQVLVDWDRYLAPVLAGLLPSSVTPHMFMLAVGVIEMLAGLVVALKPSVGAYLVALWLWGIIANLLLIPGYYDVALRDFGLSLGALAVAHLSRDFGHS